MLTMLFALCHRAVFYARLLRDDNDRADKLEGAPCPRCGRGVLHDRSYKRSPRGHPPEFEQCEGWNVRRSFTCTVCGKRVMPSSRRFLGRRVYFAPVVIAAAMHEGGADAAHIGWLNTTYDLARHTVARWRTWWTGVFPATQFFRTFRGRLRGEIDTERMPDSLVRRFGRTLDGVFRLLTALLPITTGSRPAAEGFAM
jgi:hypothetical protein